MTSVIRYFFALLSCLLLTAGFASAAQRLDSVTSRNHATEIVKGGSLLPGTMPCIVPNDKR